ncbi:MAG: 4-hydroxy-3-methylbut-2-en-1-yl diphosphate synthase, partial [Actinomycetota bacterium]|nr:4-hydroxy-3-methylbut-2-en-1-yl diphosphate synthase [Actinomycetota bacterium]
RVVPEAEMVSALIEEAERLVAEGAEARIAAADVGAVEEAERNRAILLADQGDDPNAVGQRVDIIRKELT